MVTSTVYDIAGRVTTTTSTAPGRGVSTLGWTYLDDGRVSTFSVDAVKWAECGSALSGLWELLASWGRSSDPSEIGSVVESSLRSMDRDLAVSTSKFIEEGSACLAQRFEAQLHGGSWDAGGEALQDLMVWVMLQGREAYEAASAGSLSAWAGDASSRHARMEIGFLVREALLDPAEFDSEPADSSDEECIFIEFHHQNHWIFGAPPLVLGEWALLTNWGADQGGVFEVPMSVATEICEESTFDALEQYGLIERVGS